MSYTPEVLRAQAARYRQHAADIRQGAQYADSAQARWHDEYVARDYETRAAELERHAAKLEAEQPDVYTVSEAHPAAGDPDLERK